MPLLAQLNMEKQSCRVPIFPRDIPPPRQNYSAQLSDLNGSPLRLMTGLSLNVEQWTQQRATP